jgi:uncharacterized membrane protein
MKLGIVGEHERVMTAIVGLLAILRVVQSSTAAGNVERRVVT